MDKKIKDKKLVLSGLFEDVIEIDKHYYLINKTDRICVLPYTISTNGLLDKIGVVEDFNYIEEKKILTLLNDYIYDSDKTDLTASNRILFEIIGTNVTDADKWMYLGALYNNMSSDSLLKIYSVDISDIEIKKDGQVEDVAERKNFKLLDSSKVIQTDDMIFLAGFFRLFNYFYINSLSNK